MTGNADGAREAFDRLAEEISEGLERVRRDRIRDGKITITRMGDGGEMVEMAVDADAPGLCCNVGEGEPEEPVRAGDGICGVGIVRRGRSWGDYAGLWCSECPYFRFKEAPKG